MPLFKITFAGRSSTCFFNFNSYNTSTTRNSDSYNRTRRSVDGVLCGESRRDLALCGTANVVQFTSFHLLGHEETRVVLNNIQGLFNLFSLVHDLDETQDSLGGLYDRLDALAVGVRPRRAALHDILVRTIAAVRVELDVASRHRGSGAKEDSEALLKNVALLAELLQKLSDLEMYCQSHPRSRWTDANPSTGGHHTSPGVPPLPSASGSF